MSDPNAPSQDSAVTSNVRTRSGRVSKPPVRYEPVEQVEDDYGSDDYDSDETADVSSEVSYDASEDKEDDDADDADENGNLDGFVVSDKSESDDSSIDGEPVPAKRRTAVTKRPVPPRTRQTKKRST
jgi:hypothetical protein